MLRRNMLTGMYADWALHNKGDGNPHAHIMLTMRGIKPYGTWAQKEKNVVSWWIGFSVGLNILYHGYCKCGYY